MLVVNSKACQGETRIGKENRKSIRLHTESTALERQHPPHLPFSVGFQHVCLRWDQKGISVCCLHWYIHPGVTSAREAQGASSSPGVDAQLHIGLIVGVNELMEVYESV